MKTIILILAVILSGCSHAYIAREDSNEITACCPSQKIFCDQGALRGKAQKECSGMLKTEGLESRESGSVSIQRNIFNGSVMGVSADREICATFSCDLGPTPASVQK